MDMKQELEKLQNERAEIRDQLKINLEDGSSNASLLERLDEVKFLIREVEYCIKTQ